MGKKICLWYFKGTYIFIWFATARLVAVSQAHFLHIMPISTKKRFFISSFLKLEARTEMLLLIPL